MEKTKRMMQFDTLGMSLTRNQIMVIDVMIPKAVRDALDAAQKAERFVVAAERNPDKVEKFEKALLAKIRDDTMRKDFIQDINELNSRVNEMFDVGLKIIG